MGRHRRRKGRRSPALERKRTLAPDVIYPYPIKSIERRGKKYVLMKYPLSRRVGLDKEHLAILKMLSRKLKVSYQEVWRKGLRELVTTLILEEREENKRK